MIERKNDDNEHVHIFKVLGDEYRIRGKDEPEYMKEVALYIENIITAVSDANPKLNKSQISLLTALRIADELHKLRKHYQQLEELLEQAK